VKEGGKSERGAKEKGMVCMRVCMYMSVCLYVYVYVSVGEGREEEEEEGYKEG
jgi:hypothetical protein